MASKKIAKIDAESMNSLFVGEYAKMSGVKVAAEGQDGREETGGISHDEQAFKDHDEYLELLNSALKADASQDFDPNDTLKD